VPDQFQRACVVAGDELDFRVVLDWVRQIGDDAVQRHRHRALGERRGNALGDIEAGGVFGEFARRAVGKGEGDFVHGLGRFQIGEAVLETGRGHILVWHGCLLWLTPANERR
jgi:hypothetical protein